MRPYAPSPRKKVDTRGNRREATGIAEGRSSAQRQANSSSASLCGRNECPGIQSGNKGERR